MGSKNKLFYMGDITVDSGQVLIVDPCYVVDGEQYDKVCNKTLSAEQGGEVVVSGKYGTAVASNTMLGDGIFPVFAEIAEDGLIERLIIDFNRFEGDDEGC